MSINCLVLSLLVFTFSSSSFGLSGPVPGMDFVTIPAGSYQMGSPIDEYGRDEDELQHLVNIESFELMSTEVTQGMWEEVMDVDFYEDRLLINSSWSFPGLGSDCPAYYISWDDSQDFIARLNCLDTTYVYRLPTEEEWEYVSRAGGTLCYSWGDSNSEEIISPYCWYYLNSALSVHPVATKLPNGWGVFDMVGNVSEWCLDTYEQDYSGTISTESRLQRVFRGGCYNDYPEFLRSADRFPEAPTIRFRMLGFRVARTRR